MICLICDVQVQMAFLKRSPRTTRIFVGLFHPDISQNSCLPQFSLFPVSPKGSIEQPTVISLDINDQTSFCNCWKPGYRKFSLSGYFCLSNSCANKVYEWFGLSITLLLSVMHWKINVMELPQFHLLCVEAQEN